MANIADLKNKKTQLINIKDLYQIDKERTDYVLRNLVKDLGFNQFTESLVSCVVFQNQLFILSLCPDIDFKVPEKFMYNEPSIANSFLQTLYTVKEKMLSSQKTLLVPHSPDIHIKNIVEIPVKLEVFSLTKGIAFGNYKMYHNLFVTDKMAGNQYIPDELENLLLKSMLKIQTYQSTDINRSTIGEYRTKIKTAWSKMDKIKVPEKYEVLKECSVLSTMNPLIPEMAKNSKKSA